MSVGRRSTAWGLVILLSGSWLTAIAEELDTDQRLALLERRAAKITTLTLQIDTLKRANGQLQGQIERLTYQVQQQARKQRDMYQDLTQQIATLTAKQVAMPPQAVMPVAPLQPLAQPTLESSVPPADTAKVIPQAEQAYAGALAFVIDAEQRDYPKAITAFQAFIERHPQHALVVNAHYWLGATHYALQDNVAAIAALNQVIAQYPDSAKVPDALYMIGRSQQAQGQHAAARQSWQRVIEQFPHTTAAASARKKLLTDTRLPRRYAPRNDDGS